MAKELRKETSLPSKLVGSITSKLSDEELEAALEEMRAEQERLRENKFHELALSARRSRWPTAAR